MMVATVPVGAMKASTGPVATRPEHGRLPTLGLLAWPISLVLPGTLVVAWLLLWKASRRARLWFLAGAAALSALCFPLGFAEGGTPANRSCGLPGSCYSAQLVIMWANCASGLVTSVALAAATCAIEGTRVVKWRLRSRSGPGR